MTEIDSKIPMIIYKAIINAPKEKDKKGKHITNIATKNVKLEEKNIKAVKKKNDASQMRCYIFILIFDYIFNALLFSKIIISVYVRMSVRLCALSWIYGLSAKGIPIFSCCHSTTFRETPDT